MPRVRKLRVVSVAVPTAFLILAGTAWADPLLAESMGLDVWQIGRLEDDLKRTQRDHAKLDLELQEVQELTVLNEATLHDVIEGRVELSAAAKQKWEANKHRPAVRDHLDRSRTGATFEEKTAHDLYVRVVRDYQRRPDYTAVCDRLRQEYVAAYHAVPDPLYLFGR